MMTMVQCNAMSAFVEEEEISAPSAAGASSAQRRESARWRYHHAEYAHADANGALQRGNSHPYSGTQLFTSI
jgi:hypothetical protein